AALLPPVVAVGALLFSAKSSVSDRETQLHGLENELATLPQPQSPGIDQSIKGEQARRPAFGADVLSKRLAWDRVLRDLSLVVPKDVWLTDLTGTAPQPLSVAALAAAAPAAPPAAAAPAGGGVATRGGGRACPPCSCSPPARSPTPRSRGSSPAWPPCPLWRASSSPVARSPRRTVALSANSRSPTTCAAQ